MLIYRGHGQLTPIYDNCSGSSKNKLSQFGHHIFYIFSNITKCFWKGVNELLLSNNYSGVFSVKAITLTLSFLINYI